MQVTFWTDFDRFFNELKGAFPEYEEGLRNFYGYLERNYQVLMKLNSPVPPSEQFLFDKMKMFFKDPIVRIGLGYCRYWCTPLFQKFLNYIKVPLDIEYTNKGCIMTATFKK